MPNRQTIKAIRECVQREIEAFDDTTAMKILYADNLDRELRVNPIGCCELERAINGLKNPTVRMQVVGPNDYSDSPMLIIASNDREKTRRILFA